MDAYQTHIPSGMSLLARDRVLLYTRGMDIEPEEGVGLALESLHRAGRNAGPDKVMRELFGLLREQGGFPATPGGGSARLVSAPPMNRRVLLPKNMEPLSLTAAVVTWSRGLFRRLAQKDATRDEG